ncbi:hypothetical protein niasHT_015468 [Heterodera trifolii]|uniref:Uncharacterized protein n=1 Tax=Heterodera trifolii TaxID=157864 RepID=A0ABD2L054_9BILA
MVVEAERPSMTTISVDEEEEEKEDQLKELGADEWRGADERRIGSFCALRPRSSDTVCVCPIARTGKSKGRRPPPPPRAVRRPFHDAFRIIG